MNMRITEEVIYQLKLRLIYCVSKKINKDDPFEYCTLQQREKANFFSEKIKIS